MDDGPSQAAVAQSEKIVTTWLPEQCIESDSTLTLSPLCCLCLLATAAFPKRFNAATLLEA